MKIHAYAEIEWTSKLPDRFGDIDKSDLLSEQEVEERIKEELGLGLEEIVEYSVSVEREIIDE